MGEEIPMKNYVANKTLKLRHKIAKFLTPKLYLDYANMINSIGATPRPMTLFRRIEEKVSGNEALA
jgi:hypothetical protein